MLDTHTNVSTSARNHDITAWEEANLSALNSRQRRRFQKHKHAITAYFTTDASLDEIAQQHNISTLGLLAMTQRCVMHHADGKLWGFRALLPGANVVDHASSAVQETVAIQETTVKSELYSDDENTKITTHCPTLIIVESIKIPTILSFPEISYSISDDEEYVDTVKESMTGTSPVTPIDKPTPASHAVAASIGVTGLVPVMPPPSLDGLDVLAPVMPPPTSLDKLVELTGLAPVTPSPAPLDGFVDPTGLAPVTPSPAPLEEFAELDGPAMPSPASLEEFAGLNKLALVMPNDTASHPTYVRRQSSGKTGPQRKIVHKRRIHDMLTQTRRRRSLYQVLSLVMVAIVLLGVLVPLGAGLAAYSVYNNVRGMALDGVNHLLNAKNLLPISKSDPTAALDTKKLQQAQTEFKLAQTDFVQLQDLTNRSDVLAALQEFSPDYASKVLMARHLVHVALDVSQMGQEVSGVAIMGAGLIHSSPLANGATKPLVSGADIASIDGAIIHALYYIDDIREQMSQVRMKDVPISDKQKAQLTSVLEQLPKVHDVLTQGQGLIGLVSWLLGVGHERRFLVQTLDRAELRPSGGFTGQYGVLQIQDGRLAPFGLRDVALLDYAGNGVELGRQAPPAYSSWMNFGNWGLRDSNLSGDYPTTARMSMQVFQDEGGGPVDGDISFTPTFIGHILDVTGPIHVAEYNETITSKNLEDRLHYYQQDYSAIAVEHQKSNDNSHAARKAFTSLVGKMLLDRVRHLPTKQLLATVKGAIQDIQSHDLEIYFANPQAEQWLSDHGYSGSTDSFSKQDGFAVVQSNISVSKASQYVHTTEHDDIVLDAQGGATHNLTITLNYQQKGQVYGFDTYADYIRVYAPQNAQFLSGDGFDTGQVLCNPTSTVPPKKGDTPATEDATPVARCSQYDTSFPSNARYCPDGNYKLGNRGFQQAWTIDSLGAPTNLASDLPGHAMWGGLTETPKNCTSYITLSWHVPHAVIDLVGQSPYALLVQKQGGYIPSVELTVNTSALAVKGLKPFTFKGDLSTDKTFAVSARK